MKTAILSFLLISIGPSSAAIVQVTLPSPVEIYYRGGFGTFQPFDLDGDGQTDVEFVSGPFVAGLATPGNNRTPSILAEDFGGAVVPVYEGELIGEGGQYAFGGSFHNIRDTLPGTDHRLGFNLGECAAMAGCGGIMIYEDGYIGLEFANATGIHYGWIRWEGLGGLYALIDHWAWETEPGAPIIAGAVPEPETALLSAMSLAMVLRRRRLGPRCPPVSSSVIPDGRRFWRVRRGN